MKEVVWHSVELFYYIPILLNLVRSCRILQNLEKSCKNYCLVILLVSFQVCSFPYFHLRNLTEIWKEWQKLIHYYFCLSGDCYEHHEFMNERRFWLIEYSSICKLSKECWLCCFYFDTWAQVFPWKTNFEPAWVICI